MRCLALLSAFLICGCTQNAERNISETSSANDPYNGSATADDDRSSSSSVYFVTRDGLPNTGAPEALVMGRFALRDNCLVYELIGNRRAFTPLLPKGAQVAADGQLVSILDRSYRFGEQFEFSGGEIYAEPLGLEIPERCPQQVMYIGAPQ